VTLRRISEAVRWSPGGGPCRPARRDAYADDIDRLGSGGAEPPKSKITSKVTPSKIDDLLYALDTRVQPVLLASLVNLGDVDVCGGQHRDAADLAETAKSTMPTVVPDFTWPFAITACCEVIPALVPAAPARTIRCRECARAKPLASPSFTRTPSLM
jgi:hypothetical protein